MKTLIIEGNLLECDIPSNNGGYILPLELMKEYLKSDTYKQSIDNKILLGGLTHINRFSKLNQESQSKCDSFLIEDSYTHFSKRYWLEGNVLKCEFQVLNKNSPQVKQLINSIVDNGLKLGISITIEAEWGYDDNEAKQLYNCYGADFTLNPSWNSSYVTEYKYI